MVAVGGEYINDKINVLDMATNLVMGAIQLPPHHHKSPANVNTILVVIVSKNKLRSPNLVWLMSQANGARGAYAYVSSNAYFAKGLFFELCRQSGLVGSDELMGGVLHVQQVPAVFEVLRHNEAIPNLSKKMN